MWHALQEAEATHVAKHAHPPGPLPPPAAQAWKDTSAGAIAAGGLLRLSRWTGPPRAQQYRSAALSILRALAGGYLSSSSARAPQPASILRNGTASRTDYGTGTSYGDYYLLEALAACKTMLLC